MTETQAERLLSLLERLTVAAESISESLESLTECIDLVNEGEENQSSVFNIWDESR